MVRNIRVIFLIALIGVALKIRGNKGRKISIPRISAALYPTVYRLGKTILKLTKLPFMDKPNDLIFDSKNTRLTFIPINVSIEPPDTTVAPVSIAEHFIRESSHRFLMSYCPDRDANDCSKYPQDIGCLWIGGATAEINAPPEIGRLVSVEEAIAHLHRARAAGLVPFIGKFKADALCMGINKEHKRFMTMCFCCPCCCIFKYMGYGRPEFKNMVHKIQGVSVSVESNTCVGCGECTKACLFGNIAVVNDKACISDECKGCGFCAEACPNKAISIKIEDHAFIEDTINRISGAVDVS